MPYFTNTLCRATLLVGVGTATLAPAVAEDTILGTRFPVGSEVDLIGGFTTDTPKDPAGKLYASVRFEGDWLVSCEITTGQMVRYGVFPDGARIQIKGEVERHTTFGMELKQGCELELTDTQ